MNSCHEVFATGIELGSIPRDSARFPSRTPEEPRDTVMVESPAFE
eukprot:gene8814-biopygen14862